MNKSKKETNELEPVESPAVPETEAVAPAETVDVSAATSPFLPTSTVNLGLNPTAKKTKGFYLTGVSPLKISFAFRQLGIMLKSGLALEAAISILAQQIDDIRLKAAFNEMLVDIDNGISIAESMRKHKDIFNNLVISLVSSGEQGATLNDNLFILADYLKKSHAMQQKVKGALVYPLIVLGMTSAEILGVVYFLLPKLDSMFSTFGDIPDFTRFVMDSAAFIRDNTVVILIVMAILGFALVYFLNKTKQGKAFKDKMALSFPVFKNLNKNNMLATFSQTFALLLSNAIPLNDALDIASETSDNTIYNAALMDIKNRVMNGQSLATAMGFYPALFPFTYVKMVEIGEQTSSLSETLSYVHEFYAEEASEIANNLATLLEPIMLIFIGVMIGGLAMIIIGPIYQLMSTING